jgi:hypothetical protein
MLRDLYSTVAALKMAAGREAPAAECVTSPYKDSSVKGNVTHSNETSSLKPEKSSTAAARRHGVEALPR